MRRTNDYIKVTNMKVFANHGVLEEEKENGQYFYLNAKVWVDMRKPGLTDKLEDAVDYDQICTFLYEVFCERRFDLIEAAAEYTVQEMMSYFKRVEAMELEVRKPSAPLTYQPEDISVTIYREWHHVYLAYGSNVKNARGMINEAFYMVRDPYAVKNCVKGNYYVSKPYGPVKQEDFVNGIMELDTYMDPEEFITYMHEIEDYMRRDRSIKWGPRSIDLDIIFWDDCIYNSKTLTIPHADMQNRMFVLQPLMQYCPGYRHPVLGKTVEQLLKELEEKNPDEGKILDIEILPKKNLYY